MREAPRIKRKGHFITAGRSRSWCWVLSDGHQGNLGRTSDVSFSANFLSVAIVNVLA